MIKPGKKFPIKKIKHESTELLKDTIPVELLLTLYLNDEPLSTISCFPDDLIEMAIGYLLNNGYISKYQNITLIRLCEKEIKKTSILSMAVMVEASGNDSTPEDLPGKNTRLKYIPSGCGSFDEIILQKEKELGKIKKSFYFSRDSILGLNAEILKSQKFKKAFGGLHSAALFGQNGSCLSVMEDLGRHNCIDKLAGFMAINKVTPDDKIIFTTGRLTLDLIFKIYMMSIPVIVSNSSITHSAITLAKRTGITSIGYARGGRFNIYSHPSRIK